MEYGLRTTFSVAGICRSRAAPSESSADSAAAEGPAAPLGRSALSGCAKTGPGDGERGFGPVAGEPGVDEGERSVDTRSGPPSLDEVAAHPHTSSSAVNTESRHGRRP